MSKKNTPTILDIARVAGVSKSTVSLALRNSPLSALATRKKIQTLAKEMGYRPNMLFSIMGSGNRRKEYSTDRIGVAYLYDFKASSKKDLDDLRCLHELSAEQGFFIESFDLSKIRSAWKFTDMLYSRGVCGIIIGRVDVANSIVYELDLAHFSVVCQGGQFHEERYNRVREDFFTSVRIAWNKLREAGYIRIGIAATCHPEHFMDDDYRLGAALLCVNEVPENDRIPPFSNEHHDFSGFLTWIKKWKPDAIIAFQAHHYWQMVDSGIRIPEDLGYAQMIVSVDQKGSQFISGVISSRDKSCFQTLSLLDQLIRNRIRGMQEYPITLAIEPEWNEGTTYKKLKIQH